MEKSGKFNHVRKKKWCRHHEPNGHPDEQCFQQMEKSEKIKNGKHFFLCSLHIARVIQLRILLAEEWQ